MKRLILAIVAVFAMSGAVLAQDVDNKDGKKPDKAEMVQRHTDRMVKRYDLNDQQAKKLKKLNEEYADKLPMPGGLRPGGKGHVCPHHHMNKDDAKQPQADGTTGATVQKCSLSKEEKDKKRNERKLAREAYDKELEKILGSEKFSEYQRDCKQFMNRGPRRQDGMDGKPCCGNCRADKSEKK
ncbi:hypothetical protein C7120_00990 [Prevotella sp. oral taxon 376]|uniref:DUF4890 domain-containing protein n=1 Tax=Prevotella sp. oral taxon 376 TaxID=712466 RepID=UPI000D1EF598|nr:DUF4890 domain-containing protein [Prevotella sp. oral taxon 376]PTL33237.1 hypothetical protein C7120_00990 [Prevotella sp. oral taxon 376]